MGKQLIKGEKTVISTVNGGLRYVTLNLTYMHIPENFFDVDIFLFQQEAAGRIDKKNIVFYNNPESCSSGINYNEYYNETNNRKTFELDLANLSQNISKLILGCSVYKSKLNISSPVSIELTFQLIDKALQTEMFSYSVSINPVGTGSVILGDIYKYNGSWKFSAIGHCSDSDLLSLLRSLYNADFS